LPIGVRITRPVDVILNRLAVVLWVLIFGNGLTSSSSLTGGRTGSQHHQQTSAFDKRLLFDGRHIGHFSSDTLQHIAADLRMGDLTSTKTHPHFNLRPIGNEGADALDDYADVVLTRFGAHTNFFDLNGLLSLASLSLLLGSLVHELAVVENPAHWRRGVRRYLHQVEIVRPGKGEGLFRGDDANLLARLVNEANFPDPDLFVYPLSFVDVNYLNYLRFVV
jgi:hypothetical protein